MKKSLVYNIFLDEGSYHPAFNAWVYRVIKLENCCSMYMSG